MSDDALSMAKFDASETGTLGVEMELMILDPLSYDLFPASDELLHLLGRMAPAKTTPWVHMPEGKKSMIEVATSVLRDFDSARSEIAQMRGFLLEAASKIGVALSGGGSHPFADWQDQRLFDAARYQANYSKFGYLAKMFTVFGLHVHIGVNGAENAVRACRALSLKSPVFSALCANSPFWAGADTLFASSRNNVVSQFPLSGIIPEACVDSDSFISCVRRHADLGIASGLKDFYWDVRPKPEYGTVELRSADMPLRMDDALALAFYAKALVLEMQAFGYPSPSPQEFELYRWNRFKANKDGLRAELVAPDGSVSTPEQIIRADCRRLLGLPGPRQALEPALPLIEGLLEADWPERLRRAHRSARNLGDVARIASLALAA